MTMPTPLRCCAAGVLLLQACAAPAPRPLQVLPNLQVKHAASETADAYYQLGKRHHEQGNLELAMIGYTYAIARNPRHLDARYGAASLHAQAGRLDQARAMLLAVVADYPDAAQGHNNLGYLDYLRGDHALAIASMQRALLLDPAHARARNNLRLAQAALESASGSGSAGAQLAAAPPAAPPAPAPAAAPASTAAAARTLALVEVRPSVYELQRPAPAAAPLPALGTASAARPIAAAATAAKTAARIEVANGDGAQGLARRVGALLGRQGMQVARLSNQRPFGQRTTRIEYRAGYAAQAEAVRLMIGGALVPAAGAGPADLRIVLGHDVRRAGLPDAVPGAQRIAAR